MPHLPDAIKFLQVMSLTSFITTKEWDVDQVLFTLRGNGSLGYWYRKTSNSSSYRHNDDDKGSQVEILEVSLGEESRGHRSLDNSHFYSSKSGCCERRGHRSQGTRNSTSSNRGCRGCRSIITTTLPLLIVEDMLIEVDLGIKRPGTIPLEIGEHLLTLKGEVTIRLLPDTNPPPPPTPPPPPR